MAERFHVNCELAEGASVVVRGPEAHHLGAVCRVRPGDEVCLFNGDGRQYPARVVEVTRRDVTLSVLGVESPPRELPFRLHLACVLPKGDRAQFLVEKLTELGVTRLSVLSTRRAVVQAGEGKREKLQRHVIEASKQCGRNVLMPIDLAADWEAFIHDATLPGRRLLAHPGGEPLGMLPAGDVVAAVGPEGGFTDEEVAAAVAAGWRVVGLGQRILRIETAALAVAASFALGRIHQESQP
jgi:16S rRNA (uracil1498-N3)-methyltransferase